MMIKWIQTSKEESIKLEAKGCIHINSGYNV